MGLLQLFVFLQKFVSSVTVEILSVHRSSYASVDFASLICGEYNRWSFDREKKYCHISRDILWL